MLGAAMNKLLISLVLFVLTNTVLAQSKPIRLIVPAGPGGQIDIMCRDLEQIVIKNLKRNLTCDFKPGAGGYLALKEVAKNRTNEVLLTTIDASGLANMILNYGDIAVDDFNYIGMLGTTSLGLAVAKNNKKTLAEIRTIAHNGIGGIQHYHTWLLTDRLKTAIVDVPFKSATEMLTAVIGGHIDAIWGTATALEAFDRTDKIDIVAVIGPRRLPQLPTVPTFGELGIKDFGTVSYWLLISNNTADAETVKQLQDILRTTPLTNSNIQFEQNQFDQGRSIVYNRVQRQSQFVEFIKMSTK